MKVLFLDVDGVLNHTPDYMVYMPENDILRLNATLVGRVNTIVKDTDCKVVLSSAWRNITGGREFLQKHLNFELYGQTESFSGERGLEILHWIKENGPVDRYAIVDDDSDMLEEQLPHFFQTEFAYGLTEGIAYRITYHLNHGKR